jgi:hypothetical protein
MQAGHFMQYDQWKNINAKEVQCGVDMDKECERMIWEAQEFLASTGAWPGW